MPVCAGVSLTLKFDCTASCRRVDESVAWTTGDRDLESDLQHAAALDQA